MSSHSIALIMGSTRQPRITPQIADFVMETLGMSVNPKPSIKKIDLKEWNLPFFDEPGISARIKETAEYKHEHTRAWSKEISSHDAFIFVTPQYNWGYPAPLKNALDFLFHEWVGKPAMIVTWGGHGGGKCADALKEVLTGLRMKLMADHIEMTYPTPEFTGTAFKGGDLGLDAKSEGGIWAEHQPKIVAIFEDLRKSLDGATGPSE